AGRSAIWTSFTVMGWRCHMAFMTSSSSRVSDNDVGGPSDGPVQEAGAAGVPSVDRTVGPTLIDELFRGCGFSIFKNFQHLPCALLAWSARWNGADAELEPAPRKIDFDRVACPHLTSRPRLIAVYCDAAGVTHLFCQSPAQDHAAPL